VLISKNTGASCLAIHSTAVEQWNIKAPKAGPTRGEEIRVSKDSNALRKQGLGSIYTPSHIPPLF
jgi:hypothetical protein